MKRKILIPFCMLLSSVFALTGCQTGESTDAKPTPTTDANQSHSSKNTEVDKQNIADTNNGNVSNLNISTDDAENKTLFTNQYHGPLHVNETSLCDQYDNPVQLKGLSTHGLGWYPEYVNADLFQSFQKDWNMNVIRLAMYTEEYNGYCISDDAQKKNLKSLIHQGIQIAQDLDIYIIVDWHILSDNNPLTHVEEAMDFFAEISAQYKDDPHILYEICNEPNGNTTWEDIKSYAEQVIPVIRKNSPESIIIVGTPTWSQDVDIASKSPIEGYENLMYTLHFYADTHRDDLRNKMVTAIENGLPIFVSEYGICDASGNGPINQEEANRWVDLMNQYNISYVAWNLSNKDESSAIVKNTCEKTSDFTDDDLSDSGQWLKSMLTDASSVSDSDNTKTSSGSSTTTDSGFSDDLVLEISSDYSIQAAISRDSSWDESGKLCYLYRLNILNEASESIDDWTLTLQLKDNMDIKDHWNCETVIDDKTLTVSATDFNQIIPANGSITDLGFILKSK